MRPCQMPGRALALAWKQSTHDRKDAQAMRVFLDIRTKTTTRGRHLILSGLAGFQRVPT